MSNYCRANVLSFPKRKIMEKLVTLIYRRFLCRYRISLPFIIWSLWKRHFLVLWSKKYLAIVLIFWSSGFGPLTLHVKVALANSICMIPVRLRGYYYLKSFQHYLFKTLIQTWSACKLKARRKHLRRKEKYCFQKCR